MKLISGTKPAILGVVVGGIAALTIGFGWGGWMTGTAADVIANNHAESAVTAALLPICLEQSKQDPSVIAMLADIKSAETYERREMLVKTGWATMPGTTEPNSAVATACLQKLSASF